ncbi:MAG: ParB/RepB/Spo0J family partition protein [Parachlamydiales bacterium]
MIEKDICTSIRMVRLADIKANPHQPRKQFCAEELKDLAASIKQVGIIHPPAVQKDMEGDGYILIAGERRVRASELAGLDMIPVVVHTGDAVYSAQAALIENIQRVDLNPMEVAKAIKELMELHGHSQDELAQILGKKRSTVANYLRLLGLPRNIQQATSSGSITMGHAKAILALEIEEQQQLLLEIILRDGLSVRQAEQAAQRLAEKDKKKQLVFRPRDFYLEHLARQLEEKLGTKVIVQGAGKKGKITIDYYSLDDIDRLLALLGMNE